MIAVVDVGFGTFRFGSGVRGHGSGRWVCIVVVEVDLDLYTIEDHLRRIV